ncbi:glycine zipper family protein [Ruegeria sp. Ofav3-42]|uniref:glycine zipper family protein n=1 Tax=Ruegeria sp. Ofav3-42 TaxID=2917759 RepID=UPI001EF6EA6E|nr:glycine zipper family protein [Ruegeria sp. Ofav3-42]MCG7519193.1 glycine zipper family protein [Ruegeria sp. Ofav3-42]
MPYRKLSLILPAILVVGACTNVGANYQPVIDGPVSPNYNADLAQCQALARSQPTLNSRTAGAAAIGAVGAAGTKAIIDDSASDLGRTAAAGALIGAGASALQNTQNQEVIVRNCMRGRGYNVVG